MDHLFDQYNPTRSAATATARADSATLPTLADAGVTLRPVGTFQPIPPSIVIRQPAPFTLFRIATRFPAVSRIAA